MPCLNNEIEINIIPRDIVYYKRNIRKKQKAALLEAFTLS